MVTILTIFHLGCAGSHQYAASSRGSAEGADGAEDAEGGLGCTYVVHPLHARACEKSNSDPSQS